MPDAVSHLSPEALKPHPRNEEFFSNIEGEDYERLKQSIAELGVLTPLRVAPDMTIISGHQRHRAAKELGLKQIPVVVDENLHDEDDKLQQLIASNFGRLKNDPIKQAKWLKEYERLRGVRQGSGGDQKSKRHNVALIPQEVIAKELGIDRRTLQRLKKLLDVYPELQQLISAGKISATTGSQLIARLTEEEQKELLSQLPAVEKLSASKVQKYIDKIKGLETDKEEAQARIAELEKEAKSNESEVQIEELESRLNEILAENKKLESELNKERKAKATAQKGGGHEDDPNKMSDRALRKTIRGCIEDTQNKSKEPSWSTPTEKAIRQVQAEFCYNVRAFYTDIYSATMRMDEMKGYDKEDRDGCIEFMKKIISCCNEIIEFWKEN